MPAPRKAAPVMVPDGHKYCFRCHQVLPHASFARDASQWDGKKLDCRTCDATASRERRAAKRRMAALLSYVAERKAA